MPEETYYKVSYVIEGGAHPGKIATAYRQPEIGDEVILDDNVFVITEVTELIAPGDDFGFVHVTCRHLRNLE